MKVQGYRQKFLELIEQTVLLDETDKQYWRENSDSLPEAVVRYFFEILQVKNSLVESYLKRAMQDDPKVEQKLKEKVMKMRKEIMALEENESDNKEQLENLLEQELNNI